MRNQFVFIVIAVALLLAMVGIATAATMTQSITYQGQLTNAGGTPLTGTYSMTFKLYDVASGGTALATSTQSVQVTNGQFTTPVTFDSQYFDGRALWLGIGVGSDPEMTPRQEIRPVPYALSLRPGASINGSGLINTRMLTAYVSGTDSHGFDAYTSGYHNTGFTAAISGDDSRGIYVTTTGNGDEGIRAVTSGSNSTGLSTKTGGLRSPAILAETSNDASFAIIANTSGYGSEAVRAYTTGSKSGALYGNSAQDIGVYGFGKAGGVYGESTDNTGVMGFSRTAVGVWGEAPAWVGVYGNGSLYGLEGMSQNIGVYGESKSAGSGVYGKSASGDGVVGESQTGTGVYGTSPKLGVFGNTTAGTGVGGTGKYGVYGWGNGVNGIGVVGDSPANIGVEGDSQTGTGVYGIGKTGAYFTTNQGGAGDTWIPAVNISTKYSQNPGIHIHTAGLASEGLGIFTDADQGWGIKLRTRGDFYARGMDISTLGTYCEGVYVNTSGNSSGGIIATTYGENSAGIVAFSNKSYGMVTNTGKANHEWGLYTDDYIYALGIRAPDVDLAEYMPVSGDLSPGTVLIIGPDGKLQMSTTANDTRVAGIVSTSPAIVMGTKLEGNNGEAIVAVAGRVPCKVDASNGPIHPGDLLTTSTNPGYAMKAEPTLINGRGFYPDGTILGKALGTLESGTGTIEVLVTLQ